jgi:hypothetical protein
MLDEKNKKIIVYILIGVIIILSICLVVFRKTIFVQIVKIKFPDGCVETYRNGIAVTPICSNGRMLEKKMNNPLYDANISEVINE